MTALYFHVLRPGGPRGGQAARRPVFHAIQYLPAARPGEARELPRLQGRAELSLAHQGHRRRRLLDRLGRPRRRADAVRLARAGLCERARLGQGPARGPHGRPRRRRRDGRGQHLRGPARGLEAGPAQLLVDRRLQPAEPRCGRPRGPLGEASSRSSQLRLGRGDPQIRRAAARRPSPSPAANGCATGSTTARTSSTPH